MMARNNVIPFRPNGAERKPTIDEQAGIDWWNGLTEPERLHALKAAGAANVPSAADAWAAYKRTTMVKRINDANRTFWATPEANLAQAAIAQELSDTASRFTEQNRTRDISKVENATKARATIGDQSRERVRLAADKLPLMSRAGAARAIAPIVGLSEKQTYRLLTTLGLPRSKKSLPTSNDMGNL